MAGERLSVGQVVATLADEALLDAWAQASVDAVLAEDAYVQPWFVRAMIGCGAWLAAILLIGFIMGVSLSISDSGYIVLGAVFLAAAIALRRTLEADFTNQLALAMSLAGQGLLAYGTAELAMNDAFETMLVTLSLVNVVLIPAMPDGTHRFLSVVLLVASLTTLLYAREAQWLVPLVGPLLAALFLALVHCEWWLSARRATGFVAPIRAGLVAAAFGVVMLSTVYVVPDLGEGYEFYPRPWISTVLFAALLLNLERQILVAVLGVPLGRRSLLGLVATAALLALTWPAPGFALSVLVIGVGVQHGMSFYRGAGIVFLVLFVAAFSYGVEVSLQIKSISLLALGLAVLLGRWWLLRSVELTHGQDDAEA